MKFKVSTQDEEQTALLAQALARKCKGGEQFELIDDMGAGKTTFVRHFVAELGGSDHVSSPTFTISNLYDTGRLPVYHFDFYRLGSDDDLIRHELAETVEEPNAIVFLEWAQPVKDVLNSEPIAITFEPVGESERAITIAIPQEYAYLGSEA